MSLLIIRSSAMGDVALTVPVLLGIRQQYPEVEQVLITRPAFKPFFSSVEGLKILSPDFKNKHKGLFGIIRLFREIKRENKISCVIDLHDVIRSKILRLLFRLSGVPVTVIYKGRTEKRSIIRGENKIKLKHSVERYCDAFSRAGFPVLPPEGPWIIPSAEEKKSALSMLQSSNGPNI